MRKTKIVCTIGPASDTPEMIERLMLAGANVFRLNFSHSDHAWHSKALGMVRAAAEKLKRPVAVIQDLCGPKIRVSHLACEGHIAAEGDLLRVTTASVFQQKLEQGDRAFCDLASTYESLLNDVKVGDKVLMNDGRIKLMTEEKSDDHLVVRVVRGGPLRVGMGMNLPGVNLSTESVTTKDWGDLRWGIENEVDYVALSFVRHPSDLVAIRVELNKTHSRVRLIAKIERPEAIKHIDAIVDLADGLMVARGDLGLEIDLASVPVLQKQLIELCCQKSKPVITATQMLETMIQESTPTRAEVSDIANAICDGTDALMLSGESAMGRFPEQAVKCLDSVARVTEAARVGLSSHTVDRIDTKNPIRAILDGAALIATNLEASRIVVFTRSGEIAERMSSFRLSLPIAAVTNDLKTYRQLSLYYGVEPVYDPSIVDMSQLFDAVDGLALAHQWGTTGDLLVLITALDGHDGHTDTLHLHRISG